MNWFKIFMPFHDAPDDGGGGDIDDLPEGIVPLGNDADDDADEDTDDDSDDDDESDDSEGEEDSDDEDSDDDEDEESDSDDDDDKDDEEATNNKKKKQKDDEDSEEDPDADPKTVAGNTIRDINKKYPKLFKEHPELKASFFQARDYKSVFATPQDAADAAKVVENFEFIQDEVANGNPETILDFLDKEPEKIHRFGRKFLDAVLTKNQSLYARITAPVLISVIQSMRNEAKTHGNDNLKKVADWVQKYTFGDEMPKVEKIEETSVNPEVKALQDKQLRNFADGVNEEALTTAGNLIANSVASLKDVSPAVRRTIIKDIYDEIVESLQADKGHVGLMKSFWVKAKREGFTRQSGSRIKVAYLDAVKKLLPGARAKVLRENGFKVTKSVNNKKDKTGKIKMRSGDDKNRGSKSDRGDNSRTPRGKKQSEMGDLELMNNLLGEK